MRVGLRGLGRGRPRKVTGVPQPPGPTPVFFGRRRCSQEAPDRCSVGLRIQSLFGCFSSPVFTLVPGEQTLGIPSLSTSYNDTVAAPSRVSCRI